MSEQNIIPIVENQYDEYFNEVLGSSYLPRVQLFIANSEKVKDGSFPMNHFGFVSSRDNITDLGSEVDVLVINWRPRAIDVSDKSNVRASCDPRSDLFKEIKDRADNIPNCGCQYGPEFLLWVPTVEGYATFLMGGKTTRNEARMFIQLKGKAATLKSKFIKSDNGYSWQSPIGVPCSKEFNLPEADKCVEVQNNFLNAPEQLGLEKVKEAPAIER